MGGGQDKNILLGDAKIVKRWWGVEISLPPFPRLLWQYFDGQNDIKSGCLNKMRGQNS